MNEHEIMTIEQIREKLVGMNLMHVARHVCVSYRTIYNIATGGEHKPLPSTIRVLSDYLRGR
jgi:hypothetical protein